MMKKALTVRSQTVSDFEARDQDSGSKTNGASEVGIMVNNDKNSVSDDDGSDDDHDDDDDDDGSDDHDDDDYGSDDNHDEINDEEGATDDGGASGFSNVLQKILNQQIHSKNPVLSKRKTSVMREIEINREDRDRLRKLKMQRLNDRQRQLVISLHYIYFRDSPSYYNVLALKFVMSGHSYRSTG
jgi:ABC-type Zn2+ transport system substrate-binding protein/surface adhesin